MRQAWHRHEGPHPILCWKTYYLLPKKVLGDTGALGKCVRETSLLKTEEKKVKHSSRHRLAPLTLFPALLILGFLSQSSAVEQILPGAHIQKEDLNSVTCLLVKSTAEYLFQDFHMCLYKPDKDRLREWEAAESLF